MDKSERASKIDDLANLHAPVNKFKSKYKKPTIYALVLVLLSIAVFFTDYYLLPQKKTEDRVVSISKVEVVKKSKYNSNKIFMAYRYFTEKEFEFSLRKSMFEEPEVTIYSTPLFHNITKVKTKTKDFSDELISDLSGVNFYLIIVLAISSIISLLCLNYYKDLSDNGFLNIVIFNSLMIFYILYLVLIHG
jgi:hypothetical protein